jgi:hypothetical protein
MPPWRIVVDSLLQVLLINISNAEVLHRELPRRRDLRKRQTRRDRFQEPDILPYPIFDITVVPYDLILFALR